MVRKVRILETKAKYIYNMPRPGHGYNPGDRVPGTFAEMHPWAVQQVAEEPITVDKADETKQTGGDK